MRTGKHMLGRNLSEITKRKISLAKKGIVPINILRGDFLGDKNHNWKGDKVGYRCLHLWVQRKLGKASQCEHCGKQKTTPKSINWANISRKYLRNLNDWIQLCVSCHKKYDISHKMNI